VGIVGRDREDLTELQADVTGNMLAEVIWRSINVAQENMVGVVVPCFKKY
jgi:hypothetical protein